VKKIELDIIALSHSITQSHSYAVVLGEKGGRRRLPIVIGGFEAQAIAIAMENMTPSRPLTHDLLKNISDTFNIVVKQVIINNLVDGIFYAKLVCSKNGGDEVEIDSRTSDAIAMAVRFHCPIYTYEFILDSAGIILEESGKEGEIRKSKEKRSGTRIKEGIEEDVTLSGEEDLSKYSLKELNKLLQKVLEKEEYLKAIKLRDEIKRRKSES